MVGVECNSSADKSLWAALVPHPTTQALRHALNGKWPAASCRSTSSAVRSLGDFIAAGTLISPNSSEGGRAAPPHLSSGPLGRARPRGSVMSSHLPAALRRCQPVESLHVSSADDVSLRDLGEHRGPSATAAAIRLLESREVDLLRGRRRRFLGCGVLTLRPLLDPYVHHIGSGLLLYDRPLAACYVLNIATMRLEHHSVSSGRHVRNCHEQFPHWSGFDGQPAVSKLISLCREGARSPIRNRVTRGRFVDNSRYRISNGMNRQVSTHFLGHYRNARSGIDAGLYQLVRTHDLGLNPDSRDTRMQNRHCVPDRSDRTGTGRLSRSAPGGLSRTVPGGPIRSGASCLGGGCRSDVFRSGGRSRSGVSSPGGLSRSGACWGGMGRA